VSFGRANRGVPDQSIGRRIRNEGTQPARTGCRWLTRTNLPIAGRQPPPSFVIRVVSVALSLAAAGLPVSYADAQSSADSPRKSAPAPGKSAARKLPSERAAGNVAPPATPQRQRELQSEQQELKRELAKLKRQLMATEATYEEAADSLAAAEASISTTNRRLRELARARTQVELQIVNLRERQKTVSAQESAQEKRLTEVARQQYALTLQDPLRDFFKGQDPAKSSRDAEYLGYAAREMSRAIDELQSRRAELWKLEAESQEKRRQLREITADEERTRGSLLRGQARQKQIHERLSRQIAGQRQSIDKLERDEKRLTALIEQVSRVLAEQARKEAQRRAEQAAKAAAARSSKSATKPAAGIASSTTSELPLPATGNFAQLRGKMTLPVSGDVTARFGSPRRVEGAGTAPTWKGLFIRAPLGTDVHAVAAGQIVFADWLRGFGNLMVIDHGDGYLSVYGNNESLLRNVGDAVAVGDTVASVGNTGGNEQTGLYFELRFQGRPFDPLKWIAAR
jgi:septal ring factor EnvC (AmiA/AmiB activator)